MPQMLNVSSGKKGLQVQTKAQLVQFSHAQAAIELVHLVLDCLAIREPANRLLSPNLRMRGMAIIIIIIIFCIM